MCGIAGVYGANTPKLDAALSQLAHRGPDGRGYRYQANGALGHARLAIIDVDGGQQPMSSLDDSSWLVCNGEIYNHRHLRAETQQYPYRTASDSEAILALFEDERLDAVTQLDGMFAFALLNDSTLILGRDPLGIKPLYIGWKGDALHFASEIKAFQDGVERIREFPAGHVFSTRHGFFPYYDVNTAAKQTDTPASAGEIQRALRQAVHKRLMSEVPLGVFLSGGLDSSIIAALVSEGHTGVHSFSVGAEDSLDRVYARRMADFLGTQHHDYTYTAQEMIEALPEVIYYLESFDPALVRSAVPNYFLARLASEYVTVVLSGEGADELYSGYSYLRQYAHDPQRLHRELVETTGELHNHNLQRLDRMTMAHGLEGRVPFLDKEFVALSFSVPVDQKLAGSTEKWILRKAFEDMLPNEIAWRAKQKFAEGAGSAHIFQQIAESEIDNNAFAAEVRQTLRETGHRIQSKEELYYYRIFRRYFDASVVGLVARSRSL